MLFIISLMPLRLVLLSWELSLLFLWVRCSPLLQIGLLSLLHDSCVTIYTILVGRLFVSYSMNAMMQIWSELFVLLLVRISLFSVSIYVWSVRVDSIGLLSSIFSWMEIYRFDSDTSLHIRLKMPSKKNIQA